MGIIFFIPAFSIAALDPSIDLTQICESSAILDEKKENFQKDFQELWKCQAYLNEKNISR